MLKTLNPLARKVLFTVLAALPPLALTGCVPDLNDTSWHTQTSAPQTVHHYESQSTTYYNDTSSSQHLHNQQALLDMQESLERERRLDEARIRQQEAELRFEQKRFDDAARQERIRIQAENLRLERKLATEREMQERQRQADQAQQLRHQQEQAYFRKQQAEHRLARERAEESAALAKSRARAQEWQIEAQRARIQNGGNDKVIEGYGTAGLSDQERRLRESEARALERSRARIARESAAQ